MNLRRTLGVILLVAAACAPPLVRTVAADPPARIARLSAEDRTRALAAIEKQLTALYVFPEMRPKIVDRLAQAQRTGRYDVDDAARCG